MNNKAKGLAQAALISLIVGLIGHAIGQPSFMAIAALFLIGAGIYAIIRRN